MDYSPWIIASGVALLGGIVVAVVVYRAWRRPRGPLQAMARVALDSLNDIVLPDGIGGDIYIDHLLLTSRGILVVDVKPFAGSLFGGDRMDEWTVIGSNGRFAFPNPQDALQNRVLAVRQLVRGIDVEGFVLFGHDAKFMKGRPSHVITVPELEERFARPPRTEAENLATAFAPHWRRIREHASSAS